MGLTSKKFWADAAERAVKTVAQTALSLLTIQGAGLGTLATKAFVSAVLLAGVISLLTSVVSSSVGDDDNASLVK
jgi:hypothetical protein